jgi:hypothetical protein
MGVFEIAGESHPKSTGSSWFDPKWSWIGCRRRRPSFRHTHLETDLSFLVLNHTDRASCCTVTPKKIEELCICPRIWLVYLFRGHIHMLYQWAMPAEEDQRTWDHLGHVLPDCSSMLKVSKCQGLSGDVQLRHVETLVIGSINIYKPLSRKKSAFYVDSCHQLPWVICSLEELAAGKILQPKHCQHRWG